jgi:PAS domain S-box-containing protein
MNNKTPEQEIECLKNSKELELLLLNNSDEALYFYSMDGKLIFINAAFEKITGYTTKELYESNFIPFVHPDDQEWTMKLWEGLYKGKIFEDVEYRIIKKNGEIRWSLSTWKIVSNYDGVQIGIQGKQQDITSRKQNEKEKAKRAAELVVANKESQLLQLQLQRAQKLESLGELSGGIAHDFNNILTIIVGYCGLTKMNYESAKKYIPQIEQAAERAAVLCRQMMAYAGKAQLTMTEVNMVMQVEETVEMLKSTLPQNAVIKSEFSANIPMIKGDPSQLHQVVMNLIINASEAIGVGHGEVNVSLAKFEVIAGKTLDDYNGKSIPHGEYICLEVTDNGCGMDNDTKWKLFEPFYTTKFTGRGLGMSAVLGIVKSHHGALQLFSQLGQGTTFKVYLPALVGELSGSSGEGSSTSEAAWQGSGTILLAEDEEQVRFIAKELLEMFGFTVLEAVNGKEALDMYQKNSADISLVFTDVGMPVMDGYELFEELKKLKPELPIIISSGYGDAEVSARIGSDNIAGIISKPYNLDKLQEVLKSVVEST